MTNITLFDAAPQPIQSTPPPENWYVEPFAKRSGCKTPGQCGDDCDCGCPYNTLSQVENLPFIEDIACAFPNEWLAFIVSPVEDDEYQPLHGKLVAHSPYPDEVYDAVNTVLWNQHVYVYFNGDFEVLQASYGSSWQAAAGPTVQPVKVIPIPANPDPESLLQLIYSAVDRLYSPPDLNQAIRRLRLARVKAAGQFTPNFLALLDAALDNLESPVPLVDEVIWQLEELCADLEVPRIRG